MPRRPTLADVAAAAGVSIATVNRAVAGPTNVRPATLQRIAEAAARLGYGGAGVLSRADQPELRLGVVLHKRGQAFYRALADEFAAQAATLPGVRATCQIAFAPSQGPEDMARALLELDAQVIAATGVNHAATARAVATLKQAGVPVIALLSDFAQGTRLSYVGLNNLRMGRGAARVLAQAAGGNGKLAVFVGGQRWHGHDLRETGFRSYLREQAPGLQVLDAVINLETRALTHEATLSLLARHPDVRGLYVAGGGMEGAIAALRELRPPGKVALLVNELTPESQAGLADGYVTLVCATPVRALVAQVLSMMLATVSDPDSRVESQCFLDPALYLPEFF